MVSEADATRIAASYVRLRLGRDLPLCSARFNGDPGERFRHYGIAIPAQLGRPVWAVAFQTVLEDGNLMDDATIVEVDAETGEASFF